LIIEHHVQLLKAPYFPFIHVDSLSILLEVSDELNRTMNATEKKLKAENNSISIKGCPCGDDDPVSVANKSHHVPYHQMNSLLMERT
jgi:hypothetical protein